MKYTGLLSLTLFSCIAHSASQITYLNVDNGFVHFSTQTSKAASAPSCAVSDSNEQYAVSLANENGRAVYSLLITAMASSQEIDVISAGDCADVSGVERAKSVSLTPVIRSTVESQSLYLYKADGITEIGPIIGASGADSILYRDNADHTQYKSYQRDSSISSQNVYFTGENCTGSAYVTVVSSLFSNESYNDGNFYYSKSTRKVFSRKSVLYRNGNCVSSPNPSHFGYEFTPKSRGICGFGHCRIINK